LPTANASPTASPTSTAQHSSARNPTSPTRGGLPGGVSASGRTTAS
jgi:hypothetical protein